MNATADMHEAFRLTELLQLSILDTAPEPEYDALVQLATTLFGCAISTVTLLDSSRQWFKAKTGISASETPKDISFCQYTIQSNRPLLIHDAHRDPRVFNSPLVRGAPYLRAYLGVPLQSINRARIGTFCVMDTAPRTWSEQDVFLAKQLAKMAEMLIQKHEPARNTMPGISQRPAHPANEAQLCGAWDWVPGHTHVRVSGGLRQALGLPLDLPVHSNAFATLGTERTWLSQPHELQAGLQSHVQYQFLHLDGRTLTLQEHMHVIAHGHKTRVFGLVYSINTPDHCATGQSQENREGWQPASDDVMSALEYIKQQPSGYLLVDEQQWVYAHCAHLDDEKPQRLIPVRLEHCFDRADFHKVHSEWVAAKRGLHTESVFVRNITREYADGWLQVKPLPVNSKRARSGHLLVRYNSLQELPSAQ